MSYRREQRHKARQAHKRPIPNTHIGWPRRRSGAPTGASSLTTSRLHVSEQHGLRVDPAYPTPVRRPGDWAIMRTEAARRRGITPTGPRRFWPAGPNSKRTNLYWPPAELGRGAAAADS